LITHVITYVTSLVLFVCTGNFYRSRFAEAVFNHHAELKKLNWKAFSRGLAIHWAEGYLSPFTADALAVRQIDLRHTGAARMQLTEHDLETAQRRIALDKDEHHSMMWNQFPQWADRIEYWNVADLGFQTAELALPAIESKVLSLIEELSK
jgi:protein-tyrosine phosphatase